MAKRQQIPPSVPFEETLAADYDNSLVHVCLASWPAGEELPVFQQLQITDDVTEEFRGVVTATLGKLRKQHENADLRLLPYEAGSKPDKHEIEYLTVDRHPIIRSIVNSVESVNDLPLFTADAAFLKALHFYVIVVSPGSGHPVLCFRSCSDKIELGRSRLFAITHRRGQYDKVKGTSFIFDRRIDCFCGSPMFILNKDRFQNIFHFYELVQAAAQETLERIRAAIPIHNFDQFAAACEGHLQMLKKLKNIASQPYLENLTIDAMKQVIEDIPLPIDTTITDGQEKLVFDPKRKWVILKMLDDDYLKSIMTNSHYEVNSKRPPQLGLSQANPA